MSPFRYNGYVIVSAEGMLSDRHGVMPAMLKFPGDLAFFTAGLDRADLIVHGRNSFEDQPDSPKRTRIVLSRTIESVAPDPDNEKATLWNPAGASFEEACDMTGVYAGTVAVIGGPVVFDMFLDRFDVFWLSQAPHVHLPDGKACFPGVPDQSPQAILAAHGMHADEVQILDAAHDVSVTAWRRNA
ncbi:dihydrofolate reductase [soil metagenome]